MTQDYEKADAYLNGYRSALNGAFCPETGWFWPLLSEAHAKVVGLTDVVDGADALHDEIVEAVNRELR